MTEDEARVYFLSLPEAYEDFPFGDQVQVYKINNKMFGTLSHNNGVPRINLKCDPEEALVLRQIFEAVIPGYHMNKSHWNTVILDKSIPREILEGMIDQSYGLVVRTLSKAARSALERKYGSDAIYR